LVRYNPVTVWRHLFNLLTALSLLLCVAAVAVWAYNLDETFALSLSNRFNVTLRSHRGGWVVLTGVSNPQRVRHLFSKTGRDSSVAEWQWHDRKPPGEPPYRFKHGTVVVPLPPKGDSTVFSGWAAPLPALEIATPTWPVVAVTAVLPAAWLARHAFHQARRFRRRRSGECVACGYDLRGSSGRCPECGRRRDEQVRPGWSPFDDRSTDFPLAAQSAERALATIGVLFGVIAGATATGTARAAGAVGALLNLSLLCLAFLPRLNR
jgi:hypothetical protein